MSNWKEQCYELNFCYVEDIRLFWIQDWLVIKISIQSSFPEIWGSIYPILNEREEGSRAFHTRTHGWHSCCNKNIQVLELVRQIKIIIILFVHTNLSFCSSDRTFRIFPLSYSRVPNNLSPSLPRIVNFSTFFYSGHLYSNSPYY